MSLLRGLNSSIISVSCDAPGGEDAGDPVVETPVAAMESQILGIARIDRALVQADVALHRECIDFVFFHE
jgi:hypothetical protein